MIKNLISFSGGKDSTALILWAKENLQEFDTVFCDTKWEHPLTYNYIEYINKTLLDNKLITVSSDKYDGFVDLSIKRKRVPSSMRRFCTTELKLEPMKKYINTIRDNYTEIHIYMGVRADESFKRSLLTENVFDDEYYNAWINRPLLKWTAMECFDLMKKHNIEPNPLYKQGMKRVGCMPCIMTNQKEMRHIFLQFPDVEQKLMELENNGRSFFPPQYIPDRFCSKTHINKKGETVKYPTIQDVKSYLLGQEQDKLFDEPGESCMSIYAICE